LMMSSDLFFWVLVRAAAGLSTALLLVFAVRLLCQKFLHPHARYALWCALPLALVAISLPRTLFVNESMLVAITPLTAPVATDKTAEEAAVVFKPISNDTNLSVVALVIWVIGAFVTGLVYRRQYRAWAHRARSLDGVDNACVIGILRPRVCLPADFQARYSAEQQRLIIAHEQFHIRRRDPLWNAIAALLHTLFWFHPAMPMALRAYRDDQEMSCDAAIVARHPNAISSYAAALSTSTCASNFSLQCQWQSRHPLLERISMLKKIQQRKLPALLSASLCIAMLPLAIFASTTVAGSDSAAVSAHQSDEQDLQVFAVHITKNGESLSLPTIAVVPGKEGSVQLDGASNPIRLALSAPVQGNAINAQFEVDNTVLLRDTFVLNAHQDGRASFSVKEPKTSDLYTVQIALRHMPPKRLEENPNAPPYPMAALLLGIEGRVIVETELNAQGQVLGTRVVSAEPKTVFDDAALKSATMRSYPPQTVPTGQKSVKVQVPMVFKMAN
jgi:bla regulator protein blaR1